MFNILWMNKCYHIPFTGNGGATYVWLHTVTIKFVSQQCQHLQAATLHTMTNTCGTFYTQWQQHVRALHIVTAMFIPLWCWYLLGATSHLITNTYAHCSNTHTTLMAIFKSSKMTYSDRCICMQHLCTMTSNL